MKNDPNNTAVFKIFEKEIALGNFTLTNKQSDNEQTMDFIGRI